MKPPRCTRKKKPIVVKSGSVTVKIYAGKAKGYLLHRIAYYQGGRLRIEGRSKLDAAKARATIIAQRIADGRAEDTDIRQREVFDYRAAKEGSQRAGHSRPRSVPTVCRRRRQTRRPFAGRGSRLLSPDATTGPSAAAHRRRGRGDVRRQAGWGAAPGYVGQLRHQCEKFVRMFSKNIGEVTAADVEAFKASLLELSPRIRNNILNGVRELFSFAKARRYLPRDFDQLDDLEDFIEKPTPTLIFTPEEMTSLLANADPATVPGLVTRLGGRLLFDPVALRKAILDRGVEAS